MPTHRDASVNFFGQALKSSATGLRWPGTSACADARHSVPGEADFQSVQRQANRAGSYDNCEQSSYNNFKSTAGGIPPPRRRVRRGYTYAELCALSIPAESFAVNFYLTNRAK